MRRALITFSTLILLWAFVSELNHLLAPWHTYIWIGGLFILYPALAMPLRHGLFATILGGLLCDATSGTTFGTYTLLYATAHAVIFNIRDRVPRDETAGRVVIALFANLTLLLVFSFLQVARFPNASAAWPRIIMDLVCSQVVLALITPWFVALQMAALDVAQPLAGFYNHKAE
jgi:rod shape-determining protein MreD